MPTEKGARAALLTLSGAGFKPAQGATFKEVETTWTTLLHDCSDDDIERAAKEWTLGDHRFFPKPGQLRHLVIARRSIEEPSHFYSETFPDGEKAEGLDMRELWKASGIELPPKGSA